MKNRLSFIASIWGFRMGWMFLFLFLPFLVDAQSYEQLWKKVEVAQQGDLPRSAIEVLDRIARKAEGEKNVPQLMKARLSRAMEQVKLSPDSAEVEVQRLERWAETETDGVTAALLFHVLGNLELQRNEPDFKVAMKMYRKSLGNKVLLLGTSAEGFAPLVQSTDFSRRFFQDNLYDLLVRQCISGLMSNWCCSREEEVQRYIVDLYDSLIEVYGAGDVKNPTAESSCLSSESSRPSDVMKCSMKGMQNPTAALLAHESKIVFLTQHVVADELRLSSVQAEKSFRDLLRLYGADGAKVTSDGVKASDGSKRTSDGCMRAADDALVDVSLKLAEVLCDQEKLVEAMEVLQRAERTYPKSALKEDLQRKMDWIREPSLVMQIPVVYPKYKGKLVVNYKNVTEVMLETYRLNLSPDAPELNGNLSNEVLCRSYGKKVGSQRFRLPATTDYLPRIENLAYELPEEGIYVMKAAPVGRKGKADYRLMYVSAYQCMFVPLLDGRTEVVVVDRISGCPVPSAEVVEYQRGDGNRFVSSKVWKANQQGSVILKTPLRGSTFVNARTPGHDFMKIAYVYSGREYRDETRQKRQQLTALFTDRSLYRPGQVVHVSGVRYEQLGDSLHTLQGKVMKVELQDVNGRKVGEASATTDLFGVFTVDFTLPHQVLPGHFTIHTDNKAVGIRVENYKRPTFDVAFEAVKDTYTFDDKVKVNGTVQTFAGAPVRLAKGTYKVMRSEAWLWRAGGAVSMLASGSFTTDAQGRFAMDVVLESPTNKKEIDFIPYYKYKVLVTVTDGAGETQEAELTLPVGKRSLGLQIQGLQSKMPREHQRKIQFQVMNLKKELVKKEVSYEVFEVLLQNEQKVVPGISDFNASASELSSLGQTAMGKSVLKGKAMAQTSFVPVEIYALPTGSYRLKASVRDDQGRLVETSHDFVVFSLSDKRPPIYTVQWFYQDGNNWNDGQPVTFYVGSSEQRVYMLMDVYSGAKRIRSERFWLNDSVKPFEFAYDESYGDGIVVSFAFVRNGQLYTKSVRLEKPRPEKDLALKWVSFRDKLTPGQQEQWTLKITDGSGQLVNANLLATLYDASLDKLYPHKWWMHPSFSRSLPYVTVRSFNQGRERRFYIHFPYLENATGYELLNRDTYSHLPVFLIWNRPYYLHTTSRAYAGPMVALKSKSMPMYGAVNGAENDAVVGGGEAGGMENGSDGFEMDVEDAVVEVRLEEELIPIIDPSVAQPVRQNFAETAFFYPTLRTDEKGEVSLSFTLPDALTEWKFMGLAHTQSVECGQLVSTAKSSKQFMVQANLPRFVRVGDASSLAVSLVNLSMETVAGKVGMELVNPVNNQVVFKQVRDFTTEEGGTSVVQFNYTVADDYDVLICRVTADAGEYSDGEQHYLPVLTNKEWVTETIPFQVKGDENIDLSLNDLFNRHSSTATGKRLTVELTANPNWYVIQALSAVSNPTREDAISWATTYYANALAMHLVRSNPRIQQVFEMWKAEGATQESFWSKLETNADLKQTLLEETPWLAEAQTEAEQKRRMVALFELNGMEQRLQVAVQQLKTLQTAEGGWMWYPGMPVSRYTTTQVVELMARLKAMGVTLDASMNEVYRRALAYLKLEARKEYERIMEMQEEKQNKSTFWMPSEQVIHYLYICSLDNQAKVDSDHKVNTFFIQRMLHGGMKTVMHRSFSIYQKALMTIILKAYHHDAEAITLMQSVKEYLVTTPEMGSYFDTHKAVYSWSSYRIPTQVAAMEAISQFSPDVALLDEMKLWLLKQKQVQMWSTPLATVDAVHAFLLGESVQKKLATDGKMKVMIGRREVTTPNDALGYTRATFMEADSKHMVDDDFYNHLSARIEKQGRGTGWGAIYAQYFEEMDRIEQSTDKGLSVKRTYLLNNHPLTSKTVLRVGDKLTVRLTIKNNRDMDFVSIKDRRAACMEPADQLSGYAWNGQLRAYRVNRDASTEYFIDKLPKGTHILEYHVYVNRTGTYQTGTATIQSVYAPEFTSHTGGATIVVDS